MEQNNLYCIFIWSGKKKIVLLQTISKGKYRVRGRAEVARRAHNPEVVGSNPAPATKTKTGCSATCFFYCVRPKACLHMSGNNNETSNTYRSNLLIWVPSLQTALQMYTSRLLHRLFEFNGVLCRLDVPFPMVFH